MLGYDVISCGKNPFSHERNVVQFIAAFKVERLFFLVSMAVPGPSPYTYICIYMHLSESDEKCHEKCCHFVNW